jgi:hypothetical protein
VVIATAVVRAPVVVGPIEVQSISLPFKKKVTIIYYQLILSFF